jgi:uncharacterized membrane protein
MNEHARGQEFDVKRGSGTVMPGLLGLALVLGVALYVRLDRLDRLNYWFDESFTIRMSTFGFLEMIERCVADTHPPLYFLGLKWWIALFGSSHWTARLFSVLWSVGAVLATYGFVYEACRQEKEPSSSPWKATMAASVGALCMALSPLQIAWAQQVRMYAAVAFFAVLSTWLLWRAFQKPEQKGRWIAYAASEVIGIYTHVTMSFVFFAHVVGALCVLVLKWRRSELSRQLTLSSLISGAFVGLASLPWMLAVRVQHQRVQEDFWIMPFDLEMLGTAIVKCFTVYQRPVADPTVGLWILQGMIVVLLYVAVRGRSFQLLITTAAAIPFLLLIGLSIADVNLVNARYFMAGHSILCVVVGAALFQTPTWILRSLIAIGLLVTLTGYTADYSEWRRKSSDHPGLPGLIEIWRQHRNPSEPLIYCSPTYYVTGQVYSQPEEPSFVHGMIEKHPFFTGTAVLDEHDFISTDSIDRLGSRTVWVCDSDRSNRFRKPVALSPAWQLVDEVSVKEDRNQFFLRRYERTEPDQTLSHARFGLNQ